MAEQVETKKNGNKQEDSKEHPATNLDPWIHAVRELVTSAPFSEPDAMPVEILPWLYLSDQYHCSVGRLEHQGTRFTHVLTMNAVPPQTQSRMEWGLRAIGIEQTYCPAYDVEGYDLLDGHWESDCRPVLEEVRQQADAKIVVHCMAGQNRSGWVVLAALIDLEGWTLLHAIRHVKHLRGILLSNQSFQVQICQLAERLGRLGDLPASDA